MRDSFFRKTQLHSGLLYYFPKDTLYSEIMIKKHNEILAHPRIVISDLKKLGKKISQQSVLSFLDSYGFNLPEKRVVLSILKKEEKI